MYDPTDRQPLCVFFDLTLGNLQRIYEYPEVPLALTINIDGASTASMNFTLLDITGGDVEPQIWQSQNPETKTPGGTFRFGYLNGKQSPAYKFNIESYHPRIDGNSFIIDLMTIGGQLSPYVSNNPMSGTIKEILEEFTKLHKMNLVIKPELGPSYMQDCGYNDVKSTAKVEIRHHKWANESDASYIERVIMWARDVDGKGGYRAHQGQDENGQPTLFVTRPEETSAQYRYDSTDGNVWINWEPDIDFAGVVTGQNDIHHNSYQRYTGDEFKAVLQKQNTEEMQTTFGYETTQSIKSTPTSDLADQIKYSNSETMPESVTGSNVRAVPGAASSPDAGMNPAYNSHLTTWLASNSGVLTILGDPEILPLTSNGQTLVEIYQWLPVQYKNRFGGRALHYSSGLYMLNEVEHTVSAGEFITKLYLSRSNTQTPKEIEEKLFDPTQ